MTRAKMAGCCCAALLVSVLPATASATEYMQDQNGNEQNSYGYTSNWHADWAWGYYKGECDEDGYGYGSPISGISANFEYPNRGKMHALRCAANYIGPNASGETLEWWDDSKNGTWQDWDPGYPKAACTKGVSPNPFVVSGVGQLPGGYGTSVIRCTRTSSGVSVNFAACYGRIFGMNNDYTLNGDAPPNQNPDWDPGYTKGLCNAYDVVMGVSHSLQNGQYKYSVHGILCCPIDY